MSVRYFPDLRTGDDCKEQDDSQPLRKEDLDKLSAEYLKRYPGDLIE